MAKRITLALGMFLLVAAMIVPMMTFQSSAATYTQVKRFDSSASTNSGYKVISSYPTDEYVATYEVIFNKSVSDETYPNVAPTFLFATPYVNLVARPTEGKVYIANGGFGGADPGAAVSANYTFEWGKYYRFDFVMMKSKATIRINGEDVLSYSKSMNYTSSDYIILCPAHIQMDFLSDRLYYLSGVCHHDVAGSNTGNNNILYKYNNVVTWGNSNDYNSATISAFDLEALNKCANMVETVDKVYWNNTSAMPQGMRIDTQTGDDNGYSNQTVNEDTKLTFDYMMEFDFVIQSFNGDKSNAQFGGGAQNFFVGYDFQYGAWSVINGNPWSDLGDGYNYKVVPGRRYHWKMQVTTSGVKLWIDGILVVNSTTYKRVDSNYFIFYPRGCIADITNYDWFLNVAGTWQRWRHISYSQPTEPFTGAALCSTSQSDGAGSMNGRSEHYSTSPVNFTLNSENSISYANSLYNGLSSDDKSRIRTTALTQGTNAINAIKAINAIGTVAMNSTSKGLITAARTAYDNTDSAYRGKIVNYSTLTAAETQYNTLCQNAANTVITAINNIGTVTVNSGTAITNARTAYNNCSYADARAKITNYSTLTAAETEYNTIRPVYDAIANLGTITVNSGTAISNAESSYSALSSAQKNKITNYSTLTSARTEYNTIRNVYDKIAAIGTVTVNSGTAISNARTPYNSLTSAQKNKITNYSTLTAAETEYNTIRPVYDAIANLGTITVNSGSAITSAESSYSALSSAQKNKITNYSTLTSARTEYNTIRPVYDAILNVGDVNPASDSNIVSAENSYAALNSDQKAKITNYSDLTAARTEYNTIHPVYAQIEGLGTITLASKSAISTAKTAYTALSDSQKAKVDAANSRTIAQAETEYNGRIPVATMSGTPDSSKIKANAYFTLTDGEDLSKITVSFGDTSGTIQSLISSGVLRSSSAGGGKTDYILSCTMAAKRMTDPLNYSVSGYGETYHEGVASVKYYCNALISGSYSEEVKAVANAMLVYGGCAQRYFNYNTSNIASTAVPESSIPSAYTRFDYSKLQSDMSAGSIPVSYTAMNVSFLDDTTFYIVFRIKDSSTEANRTAALNWVKTNVTYDGKKFDGTVAGNSAKIVQSTGGNYYYVQITVQNIPISQVLSTKALTVNSIDYQIGVVNYLVAAQSGSNENLKKLTLALYEYAKAMNQLTA